MFLPFLQPNNKFALLLERFYEETPGSGYAFSRLYEGEFIHGEASRTIRGEGKIEQEKYNEFFPCGYFSMVTLDDGEDEFSMTWGKANHGSSDEMISGIDF